MTRDVRCWLVVALLGAGRLLAAPASAPLTRPVKILPQHQQALLYFSVYQIAADHLAGELSLADDLHQKLLARIAQGRREADALLAKARLPSNFDEAMKASASLTAQINHCTSSTVGDIRKRLLSAEQYRTFEQRSRVTMEEVLSLQVIRADTDYVHRDLLAQLKLDHAQQQKLDSLLKDNHEKMQQIQRQYVHRIDDGRGEYLSTELAIQSRAALRAILTPAQLQLWDKALSEGKK